MKTFELVLLIGAILVPFVALIFVLPKKLKKAKQEPKEEPKKEEPKKEVKPEQSKEQPNPFKNNKFSVEDFKGYLNEKASKTSKPKRVDVDNSMKDIQDFIPSRFRRQQKKDNLTIQEEIQNLSPELKAMLFAGLLDKKDY